nr:hypothetical protein [Soybean cyst nematode associated northern cereal mosaic virus]
MELAVPRKKEVRKIEKTELYNVVSETWTACDLTFARNVDPTWFTLPECLATHRPSYIVPVFIADRLDAVYYLTGLFYMLYHGEVPQNWPADRGKVFVVVLRSLAVFEDGEDLFDCDMLPEYKTVVSERGAAKEEARKGKKKEEKPPADELPFTWPRKAPAGGDGEEEDDGDDGEAAALLWGMAELDERDGLRAIRVDLQAARDAMRAGLAEVMEEARAKEGVEGRLTKDQSVEFVLASVGTEAVQAACLSVGANKKDVTPKIEDFVKNVWESGTEKKVALLFLYFLRVGVKRSNLLIMHAKSHWKKSLLGWAELAEVPLPEPPPEAYLSALEKGVSQLVPSIALHAVTAFILHPLRYAEMKRWFCSRYEFFGQSFIGMYKTIGTVAELKSALLEMASPWNQALLAKNLYTYAVYACYSRPVADSLSATYLANEPVTLNSMKAGRFARCFSSAYMPWTTFFNEPRLSNLLLGVTVALMRNQRSVSTDISLTNEYKIGAQYGKLLAQGASQASRPYGEAMRGIYDDVYANSQNVTIEDITGRQSPPPGATGTSQGTPPPKPTVLPPTAPPRRTRGRFDEF